MSTKINPDLIVIYGTSGNNINCICISVSLSVLELISDPSYVIFSESSKTIQVPTLNNVKSCKISKNNSLRASFSSKLTNIDRDEFIGSWNYIIEDLKIILTEKI